MSRDDLEGLLRFTGQELKASPAAPKALIPDLAPSDYLLALFDFPLRVCAWLAQMRANMWVRNGITLRHQMTTYRGVAQRDVSYQRDVFLLQVAMVVCGADIILASMIDRFDVSEWMKGNYQARPGQDDHQVVDVAEDLVHLLIILLGDRTLLLPVEDEQKPHMLAIRRDIAHILCFKPLSFSELTSRLSDKVQDSDEFTSILEDMTRFHPPEGLSDSGTFELKEEFIEEIDPYVAQYSRNQREEAENIYKNYIAKKTGKPAAEVVFKPNLRPIRSGIFQNLPQMTTTPIFAQIIYYMLAFSLVAPNQMPNIPATRIESFVHFILHLTLLAIAEEPEEDLMIDTAQTVTFGSLALRQGAKHAVPGCPNIFSLIHAITESEALKSCQSKARVILCRLREKRPRQFQECLTEMKISADRIDTASPAPTAASDKELKKKQALERQARVMAQFKQQQTTFMENQEFDWGEDDFSDLEEGFHTPTEEPERIWRFPSGTCILCQEETSDDRLFGTFAMFSESRILRQTNIDDDDWVGEVASTPASLDQSADNLRPFGVASQNRTQVQKVTADGTVIITNRQGLGKGLSPAYTKRGPVSTGCGHIMHYSCFEVYLNATNRRHLAQIARCHPERMELKEFLCPLCKALGNAFLPIIWKGQNLAHPGVLETDLPFELWLSSQVAIQVSKLDKSPERSTSDSGPGLRQEKMFNDYGSQIFISPLANKLSDLSKTPAQAPPPAQPFSHRFLPFILQDDPREQMMTPADTTTPNRPSPPVQELVKIYQRLRDTMSVNRLPTRYSYPTVPPSTDGDLTFTDTLSKSLGFSIAAVEIAQRGIATDVGFNLVERIPNQSLTHLRILSESVSSYLAVGGLRNKNSNKTNQEFLETQARQLHQLFVGHPEVYRNYPLSSDTKGHPGSLLTQDAFIFLTECSVCLVPSLHFDIHHIMRLCYLAEMVRVILAFGTNIRAYSWPLSLESPPEPPASLAPLVAKVMDAFSEAIQRDDTDGKQNVPKDSRYMFDHMSQAMLYGLMVKYANAFLRKAAILMHIRFGVEFPASFSGSDTPELDRLTADLRLPSLSQLFEGPNGTSEASLFSHSMIRGWVRHWIWARDHNISSRRDVTLAHPAIFELIGLPKNYDTLTDEAIKRKCPKTGRDVTDPCVCLLCGEIFCSQGFCCLTDDSKGGCYQHQAKCAGNVGLYLNIRKCMVLFMNMDHGAWSFAPYLDKHGEVDPTLRRHHQLFLNQKRYDALLRNVWLQHGVPSTIARRLEAEVNNGGWETL